MTNLTSILGQARADAKICVVNLIAELNNPNSLNIINWDNGQPINRPLHEDEYNEFMALLAVGLSTGQPVSLEQFGDVSANTVQHIYVVWDLSPVVEYSKLSRLLA